MEDLNKNQIILLTLLVSFVTSIATGIMTISLLQEAPLEVTRNINRIVEKTIEKVTPTDILAPKEKEVTTIIVKEEDSVIDSINKNIKSVVRIKEKDPVLDATSFYGIGIIISKDGFIVADRKIITSGNIYTGILHDGSEINLSFLGADKKTNFILFKLNQAEKSSDKNVSVFIPASFADIEPKLGQTLVSLGGETNNSISVGRVSLLQTKESGIGTSTTKSLTSIDVDIPNKDLVSGSPIFNLSGDVVGMKLSTDGTRLFTPISILKKEIIILTEIPKI